MMRMKGGSLTAWAGVALGALAAGCSTSDPWNGTATQPTPPGTSSQTLVASGDVTPCFGEHAPLDFIWKFGPGTFNPGTLIEGTLHNHRPYAVTVEVSLAAHGLGGRSNSRVIGTWNVPASSASARVLKLKLEELPIQSIGAPSTAMVVARIVNEPDAEPYQLGEFSYEFDKGYSSVTVYRGAGKPFLSKTPRQRFGVNASGQIEVSKSDVIGAMGDAVLGDVTGRYLEAGTWKDVGSPIDFGDMIEDLNIPLDGEWGVLLNGFLGSFTEIKPIGSLLRTCFQQLNAFTDEGRKVRGHAESVRSTVVNYAKKHMPPRYTWVYVFKLHMEPGKPRSVFSVPVYSGALDDDGCAHLPPGTYTAWTFHRVQKDSTVARVFDRVRPENEPRLPLVPLDFAYFAEDEYPRGQTVRFTVPEGIPKAPVTLMRTLPGQVALAYGEAFHREDSGILPNETYTAFANEKCPPSGNEERLEACFSRSTRVKDDAVGGKITYPGRAVYLGPNKDNGLPGDLNNGSHNSNEKYVVAHEIGHQVQERMTGAWEWSYDLRAGISAPALCGCSGLNPTGNEIHCLQSTERQGAAQGEGYAQFFAGQVWNKRSDAECVFTYYKNFLRADGQLDFAPSAKSCSDAVRWAETHCPLSGRATEYDWMGFYTKIGRDSVTPITQRDLAKVYARNCTGSPTGTCSGQAVTWAGLESAAEAEFGALSGRAAVFRIRGTDHGVRR
ncbi:MAG: hypothetical protein KF795_29840 [Labilithrix sp.]|nr:hypothetical protein [Labilithrix sp.]